jgi:hypothetical protein
MPTSKRQHRRQPRACRRGAQHAAAARPASTTTEQHADAGKADHTKISFARFDPNAGLFGLVARLLRQRSTAVVRVRGIPVLVCYRHRTRPAAATAGQPAGLVCPTSQEVDQQAYTNEPLPTVSQEIRPQTLAWQLAIWTCQGRLMRGIRPTPPSACASGPT